MTLEREQTRFLLCQDRSRKCDLNKAKLDVSFLSISFNVGSTL